MKKICEGMIGHDFTVVYELPSGEYFSVWLGERYVNDERIEDMYCDMITNVLPYTEDEALYLKFYVNENAYYCRRGSDVHSGNGQGSSEEHYQFNLPKLRDSKGCAESR